MTIMDDGIRLDAELEMPEGGAARCPLAIVIHGFTGNKDERHIVAVSRALNAAGCATLRVDLYGHGKSGGTFRAHTLYKWLTNALTVIDAARRLDFVTDLYLCGHSQGGLTVMLAAALKHDAVSGVVALSPATMIPEGARRGELLGVSFDPDRVPDAIECWDGRLLDGNYVRVAQTLRVEDAIDAYGGPVLLVHGDADDTVPVACSVDAARRYRDAELVRLPGDTHCYDLHLDRVAEAVGAWMAGRMG